jgi:hypothetical protein
MSPKILIEQETASPLVIQVKDKKGGSKSSKSGPSKSIPRKQITKKKDAGPAPFIPGGAAVSAAVSSARGAVGGGGLSSSGSN